MTTTIANLKDKFKVLKLKNASENISEIISHAVENSFSSEKLVEYILDQEIKAREAARLEKYLKQAAFPEYKTLAEFIILKNNKLYLKNSLTSLRNYPGLSGATI